MAQQEGACCQKLNGQWERFGHRYVLSHVGEGAANWEAQRLEKYSCMNTQAASGINVQPFLVSPEPFSGRFAFLP